MESSHAASAARRTVERAAAAPYIDYPPTPSWYYPAVGAWSAALVLAFAGLADHPLVAVPAMVVLVALEGAFLGWYRRYRGTWPRLRHAPPEIARAMRAYAVGAVLLVAAVVLVAVLVHPVAGAGLAFAGVTAGLWVYERAYAAASEAVRERLS